MAQKFLSIKNFEKYQHYKNRLPPWIKLHLEILDDADFLKLPDASKWHYIGLLLLASRHENSVRVDLDYIKNRLGLTTKLDLTPRFIKDHLLASDASKRLLLVQNSADSETEKSRDREETETEVDTHDSASAVRAQPLSDLEWMDSLRTNPGYAGIDIDLQRGRCEAWCQTNGKTFSRRRLLNWLNRTDKPMSKPDWKEAFLRDEA